MEKSWLIAHPPSGSVSFVLMGNPSRPNGGIQERFVGAHIPILGVTFSGATPTNSPTPTPLTTVDVSRQYDPMSDFPTNPLNVLADLNVLAGALYIHPETGYFDAGTLELQGQYQDTTYYLAPTTTLPLLMPLAQPPLIGPPLAAALDPPLRVLIETGYDRTPNPGRPTPAKFFHIPNPMKTAIDFIVAVPTGWDDAIAGITGNPANRPFHTAPQPT
jgi:PE-PPE domain